jgi:hypothetical protein
MGSKAMIMLLFVVIALSIAYLLLSSFHTGGGETILYLMPGKTRFSLLGSYLQQSRYSMAEIYLGNATLLASPFLWNLKSGGGFVNMSFNYMGVTVNETLTKVNLIDPEIHVIGYPGLMYGEEYWFPFASRTTTCNPLRLPIKLSELGDVWVTINYSLWRHLGTIDDFSYDIWLTRDPNTTYLGSGDVEVMLWMFANESLQSQRYWIDAGDVSVPTSILSNETMIGGNMTYAVFILPHTGGASGWSLIIFIPEFNEYHGLWSGTYSINLNGLLSNAVSELGRMGLIGDTLYLNAIQVGLESYPNKGNISVGYHIYSWYLSSPS